MKKTFLPVRNFILKHKIWTGLIVIVIIGGCYEIYQYTRPVAAPQYTLSRVRMGNIVQTVTGTGQVSATNQLSITSQVSGTIESINVTVGQHVSTGDLIATIDPTDALNSLNSAKLALAKLTEAPKTTDLSNAENSVTQSYSTAFNAISSLFLDLQTIIPALNNLFYGQGAFLSDQNSTQLTPEAQTYRTQAATSYDNVDNEYKSLLGEYTALSQQSATTTIVADLNDAYTLAKDISNTLNDTQSALTYITTNQPDYLSKSVTSTQSSATTWSNTINSDATALLNAQTGIASAQNSLTTLVTGTDPLDIQSAQLAVDQAQQTYDNYFIRAPFDGVIGLLPASVYNQASGGTSIATIISDQKIATLSLDEVDAATVKVGDPVSLTFNAINNFTATGTVSEVDLVGTVSSGVVSYGVKVTINTADSRINPGMSVNATITTNEIDNVLIVPSAAIKSQGNQNYVQTFDPTVVSAYMQSIAAANGITFGSTTRSFGGGASASSTGQYGGGNLASSTYTTSTTRQFTGGVRNVGTTMTTSIVPTNTIVTIGATDGTNTQINSGLSVGAWVITKTTAASAVVKTTTTAPSLLSSLTAGGRGAGGGFGGGVGGGAVRTTTTVPAASTARPAGN